GLGEHPSPSVVGQQRPLTVAGKCQRVQIARFVVVLDLFVFAALFRHGLKHKSMLSRTSIKVARKVALVACPPVRESVWHWWLVHQCSISSLVEIIVNNDRSQAG